MSRISTAAAATALLSSGVPTGRLPLRRASRRLPCLRVTNLAKGNGIVTITGFQTEVEIKAGTFSL